MSKLIFYNFRGRGGVEVVRGEGWYYFFENLELPSCVLLAFESVVTAFIQGVNSLLHSITCTYFSCVIW